MMYMWVHGHGHVVTFDPYLFYQNLVAPANCVHRPPVSTSVWGAGNDVRSHVTAADLVGTRSRSTASDENRTAEGHVTTPGCIPGCCRGDVGLGSVAAAEVGVRSSKSTAVYFGVGGPPGVHLDNGERGVEVVHDVEVVGY